MAKTPDPIPATEEDARLGSEAEAPYINLRGDTRAMQDDPSRESREMEDRTITEDRVLSDEDRLALFQSAFAQSALPDLPSLPGYHVCWLTTTNPRDPISRRLQLGYTLLRHVDFPGWGQDNLKTGEYAGCIAINEMLAARLPMRLFGLLMKEAHYDAPNREQEKLTNMTDTLKDQIARAGGRVTEFEGNRDLRTVAAPPVFRG